jgi:excisionase family DNA binding protein
MTEKPTLNQEQAAKALGLSREQLKKAVIAGSIPAMKLEDRWVFSRRAIEAFLETGKWPAPAGADRLEAEELATIRALLERMSGMMDALGIGGDVDLPRGSRRRVA